MLTEQHNIRDVIMFPMMKDEHNTEQQHTPKDLNITSMQYSAPSPENLPGEEQAIQLIDTYLTDTKRHCLQVGEIMRAFAKELGQDEHYRWLAGALHDIDRDHIAKDADKHLKDEFDRIMATIDAPELLKNDIKSHGDRLT